MLTRDDPAQADAAERLLADAALIVVPTVVLCEVVWVLARGYRVRSGDIAATLRGLMDAAGITLDRSATEAGLAFLEAGADFADGVIAHAGRAAGADVFISFDAAALQGAARAGVPARSPLDA